MMELFGYWRSSAAYRVRIALNLKGLRALQRAVHLQRGEQRNLEYIGLNPQGLVPTLMTDAGLPLTQSTAILEWLEEQYPTPPLLPSKIDDRAAVRAMCQLVAADIHPLNNLRVLDYIRETLALPNDAVTAWARRWIEEGLGALEKLVETHGGDCCFGDRLTFADICLVPQLYSARRFGCNLAAWRRLSEIDHRLAQHPAFQDAIPEQQPDAPATA